MSDQPPSRFSPNLLNLSAYFIIPAVGVPMLHNLFEQEHPNRWVASGLLAAFTLLLLVRSQTVSHVRWGSYVYTALQTGLIAALLWLPPQQQLIATVLFFVVSAEAAMMFPPRIVAIWITLFSAVTLLAYAMFSQDGLIAAPIYVTGYIFFAIFAQQTARAEAARAESQRLLEQLQAAHEQLQHYAAQAEELAVSQERNRLAREMHDTLGHRLTVAAVQLQAAERLIASDPGRAAQMVDTVRGQIREALGELRRTVATLRAPLEADLALLPALKRLASNFEQATGVVVHTVLPNELPPLSSPQRQALYRGAQEGLTNVQKHAQAHAVWLQLSQHDGVVSLQVRDDGVGLQATAQEQLGFGLRGLRERAVQLGGELRVESLANQGAQIVLTLPLEPVKEQVNL